jgi:N-acyl-D-aspartate/D-glutamate deacylase
MYGINMEKNNLHDVVIRSGKIIDGSGKKPFTGDIAIDDGKISLVGTVKGSGKREICV